jgi:hypothetical protein
MKIRALVPALAVLVLAGCGVASSSFPAAAPSHSASPAAVAAVSCRQQYETWKHSAPALAAVRRMKTALNQVSAAASAEDIPLMSAALHRAGRQASALSTRYPMPRCADPRGYWPLALARITAAGDNAASASGLGALLLAEAPLQTVPGIEKRLTVELNRTVGKNR